MVDLADLISRKEGEERFEFAIVGPGHDDLKRYAQSQRGRIVLTRDFFNDPKDVFLLLHEMGHSILFEENPDLEKIEELYATVFSTDATEADKKEALSLMAPHERDAWARAIKSARSLRDQFGVDLFSNFADVKEFSIWLRKEGLYSYELKYHEAGGPEPSRNKEIQALLREGESVAGEIGAAGDIKENS